jgi:hypothetical protein
VESPDTTDALEGNWILGISQGIDEEREAQMLGSKNQRAPIFEQFSKNL